MLDDRVYDLWHNGMVLQVTNTFPDIKIEEWLYSEYPELRISQMKSIHKMWQDAVKGLSPQIKSITPSTIYIASNALNYVSYKFYSKLTGNDDFFNPYIGVKELRIADKLISSLKAIDPQLAPHKQDLAMATVWAELLGIKDWFGWTGFESIPIGYEEST